MIEIETKLWLNDIDKNQIIKTITDNGFIFIGKKHQIDSVYLPKGINDFANLKLGDPVIRIRTENDKNYITLKKKINEVGDCIENEFGCDNSNQVDQFINNIGFVSIVTVDKNRATHQKGDCKIEFDTVKDLGEFLEIEVVCNKNESDQAHHQIDSIITMIGIDPKNIESKKYDYLVMNKIN